MRYPNGNGARRSRELPAGRRLWCAALACGAFLALAPRGAEAQQARGSSKGGAATDSAKLTPADSAACVQVVTYAMQHPEVLQKSEQLKMSSKMKVVGTLPDTLRTRVSAAIVKGQGDTLKAIARRTLDAATAPTMDEVIDFVVAFPDSVRRAVATLFVSGRSMTCS